MSTSNTDALAIARRYATAMFALAVEAKKEETLVEEITTLADAVAENAELHSALANPLISRAQKSAVLEAIAHKAHSLTKRSLGVIASGGRADLLPAIARQLRDMLNAQRNELVAEVTSAKPLSASVKKQLAAALAEATGKPVNMELKQDPAVLGGLAIQLGSLRLDATLAGALNHMRSELIAASNRS